MMKIASQKKIIDQVRATMPLNLSNKIEGNKI